VLCSRNPEVAMLLDTYLMCVV